MLSNGHAMEQLQWGPGTGQGGAPASVPLPRLMVAVLLRQRQPRTSPLLVRAVLVEAFVSLR